MKEMKRFLSLFLCLVMLVGYLPANAFADEVAQTQQATQPVVETVAEDSADETGSADETATNPEETTVDETTPDEGAVIPGESTDATEGVDVVPGGDGVDEEEIPEETEAKKPVRPGRPVIVQQVTDEAMSGDTAMIADDVNPDATIVIAASDYQKNGVEPKTNVSNILKKIKVAGYASADGFLFGGDYTQSMGKGNETKTGKEELQSAVQKVYGTDMDEIYVQGNHDPDSAVGNTLTASGAHDTEDYGVYVINQKDYPWGYGSYDMKTVTKATADALDVYLDAKAAEGYGKPIFVVTHLPLHITSRNSQGDGKYAKYLYDVLDEAGNKGLNIIFMFGHNHSSTYDDYIGGGAIYLAEGSTISIAKEGSTSSYFTDELSFTYMNCGYVGYSRSSADSAMTMTLFEITDDEVVVKRYDANGLHNLKAKGTGTGYPDVDTTVVETDTITLTTPTTGDDDDPEGGTTAPTQPSTVTDASGKVSVTAPGVTAVTVNKSTPAGVDTSAYSSYARYDITLEGYTDGDEATVTIQLDEADGFRNGLVQVLDVEKNVTIDAVIANGAVAFKTTHFSEYDVMQTAETDAGAIGNWTLISDGAGASVYEQATSFKAGESYAIVGGSDPVALMDNNGSLASQDVTISGNTLKSNTKLTEWTISASSNGSITSDKGNRLGYSSSNWNLGSSGDRTFTVAEGTGGNADKFSLRVVRSGGRSKYYFNYNGSGWTSKPTNPAYVRLYKFVETEQGTSAEYAEMVGAQTYQVSRGTAEEVALAKVKAGIKVLVTANPDGSEYTVLDNNNNTDIDWEWDGTYNGTTAGEYTMTIKYKGVALGTVKVIVPAFEVNSATVEPASATVDHGVPQNTDTGAKLSVDVKEADIQDIANVPVTIAMLRHPDGSRVTTSKSGTFTNLQVVYNGVIVYEGFTLIVSPREGIQYPNYPDPGAVKVNKTATGVDFQASGVATVELSASGIPMNEGVDVVLVLDASSSMDEHGDSFTFEDENGNTVTGKRIDLLRPVVNNLIQQFKTKRQDGSDPDIDIAIVTFNGNTIKQGTNNIGSNGSRSTTYGIKTGDKTVETGWEKITNISSTWATDNNNANTPTSSGTNYDYGLQTAYDLLKWKKEHSTGVRQQFVLFLSDGSPSQYNGVESNDGEADYESWLFATYQSADEMPSTITTNKGFYYGFNNGNGQLHRAAEAIKALPGDPGTIIRYSDEHPNGELVDVNGLGATVYSIGMLLQAAGQRSAADQEKVLKTIASDDSRFRSVENVLELNDVFNKFAQEVLLAATNARFVDEMGPMFDLQLTPVDYSIAKRDANGAAVDEDNDGETDMVEKSVSPVIEIRSYEIYTRGELENADGTLSEANAKKVGTRKVNGDGSYKYTTVETVTFQSTKNEATGEYTLTGATSDQLAGQNILKDNVVCGKYFYYNTTKKAVTVDGITVGPETFYWKIGDIKTTEFAIRYNVYLTGSLDGEREAGSYDTNKSAVLYYDNYLGTPSQKATTSPTMAWGGANVNYAFYLVDASSGEPVNQNGVRVPFEQRVKIVNPTKYGEIILNNSTQFDSLSIAAGHVLPEGYWLYDEASAYTVEVHSNGTGSWAITRGEGLTNPDSTYVTDYNGNEYTNEDSDNDTGYDYTHTTVWFAVKWEPRAVPDTVVIDYGLPVDVHVMTNDLFGKYGVLAGVQTGNHEKANLNQKADALTAKSADGAFGTAVVNVPESGATEANSVITYTLSNMQMNVPEVFTYAVQYANPVVADNNGYYYGSLTVIPATTVYYEDTFLTLTGHGGAQWEQEGPSNAVQDEDRPGDINFAFDTVIDANNVYGYDSNYTNCSTHSLGSAAKINVSQGAYGTAEFTFYGTGFDVISLTSGATGTITVLVKDANNNVVRNTLVDTYYGMNKDGTSNENASDALYQVPVIKIFDLEYGKYTVKITAAWNDFFDHVDGSTSYDLYLDAIRIYDPTGDESNVANDAYLADGEAYPEYFEVRDKIIDAKTFDSLNDDEVNGVVFIDCNANTTDAYIADYTSYGPNNEVYLDRNDAIAFGLNATAATGKVSKVQLAIKTVGGTGKVEVYGVDADGKITACLNETISTATDMYYDITDLNGKTVVIKSTGDAIISITNVKATYTVDQPDEPAEPASNIFRISKSGANAALASMIVAEEPVVPETSEPVEEETEAPETSVPETSEPETSEPEETEPEETKPESSKDKLEQALAKAAEQAAKVAQNMKKAAEQAAKALSKLFSRWF